MEETDQTKYGLEVGEWFPEEPKGSFGVGLWKDIVANRL